MTFVVPVPKREPEGGTHAVPAIPPRSHVLGPYPGYQYGEPPLVVVDMLAGHVIKGFVESVLLILNWQVALKIETTAGVKFVATKTEAAE